MKSITIRELTGGLYHIPFVDPFVVCIIHMVLRCPLRRDPSPGRLRIGAQWKSDNSAEHYNTAVKTKHAVGSVGDILGYSCRECTAYLPVEQEWGAHRRSDGFLLYHAGCSGERQWCDFRCHGG